MTTVVEPRPRLNSNLSDHEINFGELMNSQMNEMNYARTVAQLDAFYGRGKSVYLHTFNSNHRKQQSRDNFSNTNPQRVVYFLEFRTSKMRVMFETRFTLLVPFGLCIKLIPKESMTTEGRLMSWVNRLSSQ